MKNRQRSVAILAAVLILAGSFPGFTVRAEQPADEETTQQEIFEESESESSDTEESSSPETEIPDTEDSQTSDTENSETEIRSTEDPQIPETDLLDALQTADTANVFTAETETVPFMADGTAGPLAPDEPPTLHAQVGRLGVSYAVRGTFTDVTPGISQIYPLYSLDGETWHQIDYELILEENEKLENAFMGILEFDEPLNRYVAGEIDCFYVKLHITKQNGCSYESSPAVIDNTDLQPVPGEITCSAYFSPAMVVREPVSGDPQRTREYGRYQLTISEGASVDEVSALLPETLPVEVQMGGLCTTAVVECPVTWKPLSLTMLSAGESIVIPDAAEKILVPAGTQLRTPLGSFQLDEPLSLGTQSAYCDYDNEVELVLNISTEDRDPTGVLAAHPRDGLKIALHQKATGATSIECYVMAEGGSEWTRLPDASLLKELNTQLSTENSGYALILRNDQEPLRSYLEAEAAGETPTPFFVGLKIEGGIYDGKELVLAWPGTYGKLPDLPKVGGAGGNEGNAGAANKDDSTESGQRPYLPQTPEADKGEESSVPGDSQQEQQAAVLQTSLPADGQQMQPAVSTAALQEMVQSDELQSQSPALPRLDDNGQKQIPAAQASEAADAVSGTQTTLSTDGTAAEQSETGQRPNLPQSISDTADQACGRMSEPLMVQTVAARHTPLMAVTATVTTVAAGGIGTAVCMARKPNLLRQIAQKIRKILHKCKDL